MTEIDIDYVGETTRLLSLIREGKAAAATLARLSDEGVVLDDPTETVRLEVLRRRGQRALDDLLALHEPLVRKVYKDRFASSTNLRDDMYQEGRAALARVADDFDPSDGVSFGMFAYRRIFNAMRNVEMELRHATPLRRRDMEALKRIQAALVGYLGHGFDEDMTDLEAADLTPEWLSEISGVPVEVITGKDGEQSLLPFLRNYGSLNKVAYTDEEGNSASLMDMYGTGDTEATATDDPEEDTVARMQLEALLAEAAANNVLRSRGYGGKTKEELDQEDFDLLWLIEAQRFSAAEAGEILGMSRSTADTRYKTAKNRMANYFRGKEVT